MKIDISAETKKASKKLEAKTNKEYTNRQLKARVEKLEKEIRNIYQVIGNLSYMIQTGIINYLEKP